MAKLQPHQQPLDAQRNFAPPPPGTETLQLWVEHGLNVSASSAILISRWHDHRVAANAANTSDPPSNSAARRTAHQSRPTRIIVRRDHDARAALRSHRARLRSAIATAEQERRDAERRREEREIRERKLAEKERLAREKAQADATAKAVAEKDAAAKEAAAKEAAAKDAAKAANANASSVAQKQTESGSAPKSDGKQQDSNATAKNAQSSNGKPTAERKKDPVQQEIMRIIGVFDAVHRDAEVFRQDFSAKKMRMEIKKRVNLAVNQIAASIKQVTVKVQELSALLAESTTYTVPGAHSFALREMATRLVAESDRNVSVSRGSAFAVANVIVGVASSAYDPMKVKDIFLGAFYRHCIYTMPAYGVKRPSESKENYQKRLGYKEDESAESYIERMSGCVGLLAAVLQIDNVITPNGARGVPNPFPLDLAWTWLARIVNKDQRAITPCLVIAFLEYAGYNMGIRYRRQFAKLMASIQRTAVMGASSKAPKDAVSRLDEFIVEYIKAGCIIREHPCILPQTETR